MADLHFLRPELLLAALPLLLVWWLLWRGQNTQGRLAKIVAPHLLEHLLVADSNQSRLHPIHLLFFLWLVAVIAVAGPAWEKEPAPFADDDAGLVVLLKVNSTMEAMDVQPSRLARAKHKLHDLLEAREGMSTGLIVYSGSAHLVMPLTRDQRIVTAMIEDLTPELMPADGDALSAALALGSDMLKRAGVPGSVLVMADNVAPSQVTALNASAPGLPVQFLAMTSPVSPVEPGLVKTAAILDAPVTSLTVDNQDVLQLAKRARSDFKAVAGTATGDRWRDAGYFLLPLIALLALAWSRRGWLVR